MFLWSPISKVTEKKNPKTKTKPAADSCARSRHGVGRSPAGRAAGLKRAGPERDGVKVGAWVEQEEKTRGGSQNCMVVTAGCLLTPGEDQRGCENFSSLLRSLHGLC